MFRQSESIAALSEALSKAQGEVENATKNASNPHFKSRYADLAEIISTIRPVLAKHGLAVLQLPGYVAETELATLTTRLTHKSGEWMEGDSAMPVVKKDPQGCGSATTYLRRYTQSSLFNLAQEDDDANAASHAPRATSHEAERPAASPSKPASDKQKGFVENLAKSSVITDDERDGIRRRVLAGMSSADASKAIEWLTETIAKREKEDAA